MKYDEPYLIFACCVLVHGSNRSLICDVQRKEFIEIDKDVGEFVQNNQGKTLNNLIGNSGVDEVVITSIFGKLFEEEIIFFSKEHDLFPPIKWEYKKPFIISHAIIDLDENSKFDTLNILTQLNELNCKVVQLRFFSNPKIDILESIFSFLEKIGSFIQSVELLFSNAPFSDTVVLLKKFPRITSIQIFNSNCEKVEFIDDDIRYISYSARNVLNEKSCGLISKDFFVINETSISEAKNFNSCLNGKISVDRFGTVKNCPSMSQSFGNINEVTLSEVIQNTNLRKVWDISKDQIEVCKDCEFRYICTDCRAYLDDPDNIYSKPLKCGYNPYNNEWQNWSTNPLKKQSIGYYGINEKFTI